MKAFLILAVLLSSTFAKADLGMRSYDCDKGDDGIGGYYCHYDFAQCIKPTCEAAVECIVKKVHHDRENKSVSVYIAQSEVSKVVRNGQKETLFPVQSHYDNCNGRQCLTPMYVYTHIRPKAYTYKVGQCEPIALKLIGAE